ncbi:UDP-glucuronate:xylan alpha-glucuronosyltransferase 1-like protein, partial [Drosera capensis]
EDIYKRNSERSKAKDIEKSSQLTNQNKGVTYKPLLLQLALTLILGGIALALLYMPPVSNHRYFLSHSSMTQDPRYISSLNINWEDISRAIAKLKEKEYHAVGLLNFNKTETNNWEKMIPHSEISYLRLDYADENVRWDTLYPEWIDEEEESEVPACPYLPKLEAPRRRLDLIAVKLPCQKAVNWSRDVARLHLQLATAGLAASRKGSYPVHLLFVTNCFPIPNLFACKELVVREGGVWLYKPHLSTLREKFSLPVGSCELALPLKANGKVSSITGRQYSVNPRREAYVTILHSADDYVCGALAAAQSIRMAGSTRDLVILVDKTISSYHRSGLKAAGWKIRIIERIRNPKAEKDTYNEWNYSKFRLWQLTDYDKIIFIDADLLILRNIDFLFAMPEISATGNNGTLFNSGVMVIEPSLCTFQLLMDHINEIESYNGGDQGYLNEIFTWWHRIPVRMNFLKHFWEGDTDEIKQTKTMLFGAEPPILYVLHYLGMKPWLCFRDYDCNWNSDIFQEFASDTAHATWWKVHDAMPEQLQQFCMLRSKQKALLEWDRRQAEKGNYSNGHWKIKIHDTRVKKCIDKPCSWWRMLRHWGEKNWTDNENHTRTSPTTILTPIVS